MIYKIGDTLINTDMIVKIKKIGSEIYTSKIEGTTVSSFIRFAYDGGDVIVVTYPNEQVTYSNQNYGYSDALKLYDWFEKRVNNDL